MKNIISKIMQYKKKILFVLVLVLLASTGYIAYFKNNTKLAVAGTSVSVERGDIQSVVSATGTISAVNSVDISSRVTGLITEVKVNENDTVKAGQVLIVLDNTSLKDQLAQYHAQLENYTATYERSSKLASIGAESVQQLDSDRTNYLVAQATYNSYASQLEYYTITSPVDGIVIGKPTPAGQTVAQGISTPQVIMTIADLSKMQIKVLVDESDIGKITQGQKVTFTVDAYPNKTFTGAVTLVSKSATTQSNVVYYPVYVDVDSSQGLLFPNMTARVTINIAENKNTLVIPLTAVKENNGQNSVQLMVNGQPQNTPVTIGLTSDDKVEIVQGINEGDQILLPAVSSQKTSSNQQVGPPPF